MAIINVNKQQVLERMWRKENPCALLAGMQTGAATVESTVEVLQKIKDGTDLWPSDSTFGNRSEGTQNTNLKKHKHIYVHYSVIYNLQDMGPAQVSISRWVDKTTMGHVQNGIVLGHKKEENLTFCESIDGPWEYYGMWNKLVRERLSTKWFHLHVGWGTGCKRWKD